MTISKKEFGEAWDAFAFTVPAWAKALREKTGKNSRAKEYYDYFVSYRITKDELKQSIDSQVAYYEAETGKGSDYIFIQTPARFIYDVLQERKKIKNENKSEHYCPCCGGTGRISYNDNSYRCVCKRSNKFSQDHKSVGVCPPVCLNDLCDPFPGFEWERAEKQAYGEAYAKIGEKTIITRKEIQDNHLNCLCPWGKEHYYRKSQERFNLLKCGNSDPKLAEELIRTEMKNNKR